MTTQPEPMTFTLHDDGRCTADKFPDLTSASLDLLAMVNPAFIRVAWEGVKVTMLGVEYQITHVDFETCTVTLQRRSA